MQPVHAEFIRTEETYIKDLLALSHLCRAVPAFGAADGTVSGSIFLNVPEILAVNRQFLHGAKRGGANFTVTALCHAFIDNSEEMARVYRPYVAQHQGALDTLDACRGNEKFEQVVSAFLTTLERASLGNMLIKPVQRICKYPLLFQQLADDPSYPTDVRRVISRAFEASLQICRTAEDQISSSPRVNPQVLSLLHETGVLRTMTTRVRRSTQELLQFVAESPPSSNSTSPKSPGTLSKHGSPGGSPSNSVGSVSLPSSPSLPYITVATLSGSRGVEMKRRESVPAKLSRPVPPTDSPPNSQSALLLPPLRHPPPDARRTISVEREKLDHILAEMTRLQSALTKLQEEVQQLYV